MDQHKSIKEKAKFPWSKIRNNILKYKEASAGHDNCHLNIQCTLTSINLVTIDKWWDEMMDFNIDVQVNRRTSAIPSISFSNTARIKKQVCRMVEELVVTVSSKKRID